MKKSIVGFIIAGLSALLAFSFLPRMIQYLVPEESESFYERVEVEKYEIVFPMLVNSFRTNGSLQWSTMAFDDSPMFGAIQFSDEDCLDDGYFYLVFKVYCDEYVSQPTLWHVVDRGEYGRYVISETQVEDEPVAYTLEPIYEYVLVD
jgi:hypothetical protein